MDNVWWYHKPCSCSNSSLFELDDSWFVEAIQYFVTCSELSLSLIYSCTVYQSTYLNTFLLWITGGQESVVYHVNSGTDFRRGQDCQVVCPENCWCLCVVSLPERGELNQLEMVLDVTCTYILILRRLLLLHLLNLHLEHHLVVPIQISRIFFIVLDLNWQHASNSVINNLV